MKTTKASGVSSQGNANSYIQPSLSQGHPAHVAQDGWIAYLPSMQHAKASFQSQGRGFFKGKK